MKVDIYLNFFIELLSRFFLKDNEFEIIYFYTKKSIIF